MGLRRLVKKAGPALRILGLASGFLILFGTITLVLGLLFAWIRGSELGDSIITSMICALIASIIVARVHIRHHQIRLSHHDRRVFFENVKTQLSDLGYEVKKQTDSALILKPSFHSGLFGGGISVRSDGSSAEVKGPKIYLERLQKRLRNQSFLEPLQRSLALARKTPHRVS